MNDIIYGIHNIEFFIKNKKELIIKSYTSLSKINIKKNIKIKVLIKNLIKNNIPIYNVSKNYINILTKDKSYKNICIEVKNKNSYSFNKIEFINKINNSNNKLIILILENISDPRNLGSCIRCADAAGLDTVIVTKKKLSSINNTVKKTSSGSINNLKIIKINDIKYILKILKKYKIKIIATSSKSNNIIYNINLKPPIAYIFGSEELGITNNVKEYCDIIIKIPMYGYVNSLNISVSVGICLFESIRQNNFYINTKI